MKDLRQQLESLGKRSRRLLMLRRLCQWLTCIMATWIALAFLDYLLRLPSAARLIIVGILLWVAVVWLGTRLIRAISFRPTLSELAIRAERIYPHLTGVFAAGVDLAGLPPNSLTPTARAMADATIQKASELGSSVDLKRLVDTTPSLRWSAMLALVGSILILGVLLLPTATATAASRWFMPWGDAQWPKRVAIETTDTPHVMPADGVIPIEARIVRGDSPNLDVTVRYRFELDDSEAMSSTSWRSMLMSRQRSDADDQLGPFSAMVELPAHLANQLEQGQLRHVTMRYTLSAGDATTEQHTLRLVARPQLTQLSLHIEPPPYARSLLASQTIDLSTQGRSTGRTVSVYQGATVRLLAKTNKPIPAKINTVSQMFPELDASHEVTLTMAEDEQSFEALWVVSRSVTTPIHLRGVDGLTSQASRPLRLEMLTDEPPSTAMTEPTRDLSVLPQALIPLAAMGQDDIALESLVILAERLLPRGPDSSTDTEETEAEQKIEPTELASRFGQSSSLSVEYTLDLQRLQVEPGDTVLLYSQAKDIFAWAGQTHDPVRSSPRRLLIIDEATLMIQVSSELAGLRQRVVRMEQTQSRLLDSPLPLAEAGQEDLTQQIRDAKPTLERIEQQLNMNRVEATSIRQLLQTSSERLDRASQFSQQAQESLAEQEGRTEEQREREGRQAQQQTQNELEQLIDALDQGADALSLQLELEHLRALQDALSKQTRATLPETAGKSRDELTEQQKQTIDELAKRQDELAKQANEMIRKMQSTAGALSRQSDKDQDQAMAQALAEAAAIAQRQGLTQTMDQASSSSSSNQLSRATQQQNEALNVMDKMLKEMDSQQTRMREMLRRRLAELVERLEVLIERQETEIARLTEWAEEASIDLLEPEQVALRKATMAVQVDAERARETMPAAETLGKVISSQASAILAMRALTREAALTHEQEALAGLRKALEQIEEVQQEQEEDNVAAMRAKLRQDYLNLADEQDALREKGMPFADKDRLNRRDRAQLMEIGQAQDDIGQRAAELGEQVENTLVFNHLHQQIDDHSSRAGRLLERAMAEDDVFDSQWRVASYLRQMAEALKDDPPIEFEQESGGGGGGGGTPPLIPPVAELKLMRSLQTMVLDSTRLIDQQLNGQQPDAAAKKKLMALSTEQRELARLGQRLIQSLQQDPTALDLQDLEDEEHSR